MSDGKSEPLVRFIDVSKSYDGKVDAVRALSLDVEAGEFLTLLGPSGSGKTTTLTMLAGFERPSAGRIFIAGDDVTMQPVEKRGIGMVFQNYALFPHMTVNENLAFPLQVRSIGKAEIGLFAAHQFDIDFRQNFRVEQSAMLCTAGIVDIVTLTQRIKTVGAERIFTPRQNKCVDNALRIERFILLALQFGIQKAEIETRIMSDEFRVSNELEKLVNDFGEFRLVFQKISRETMHAERGIGHIALGVQITMKGLACRNEIDQFDTANFNDAIPF